MYGVRTVYRACTDVRYGTGFFRTRTYVHTAEPLSAGVPTLCVTMGELGLL
jgi:hypothetical protein